MNNAVEARRLLRAHRYGALSTLSKKLDGFPFGSITSYVADQDGSLLILVSALAEHSKNIRHDPRVSLITHNQHDPDIQMQGRVTLIGTAQFLSNRAEAGSRYVRLFPEAATYLAMGDFSFCRIQPAAIRYIGGVGRIHWANMSAYATPQAVEFSQQEESLLNAINTLQQASLRLLVQHHYNVEATEAQAIAVDCDGLDIRSGEHIYRLDFADVLPTPSQLKPLSDMRFQSH